MARPNRTKKRKSNVIVVNFKGVEGRGVVLAEGNYKCKPVEITQEDGKEYPYLKWTFEVTAGKSKGAKAFTNTSLAPQALWNLRTLLELLSVDVPDDELEIDTDEIIASEAEVMIVIEHETYEGRPRAQVANFFSVDDAEEDDEDDEPKSKRKSRKDEDEDDEDEKPARKSKSKKQDDDEDDDEDDEPKKPMTRAEKRRAAKAAAADEDDDEDDEDEKPRGKKGKADKKSKKKSAITTDELEDMSEAELEDLVEEHELDVDLSKSKTLSRKRNKVQDALEEAGLLEAA